MPRKKPASTQWLEAVAGLRAWAARTGSVARIEETKDDKRYGLVVRPDRADAKRFEMWIGIDGKFDLFCGAIRFEHDPIPPASAPLRFCEAVGDGKVTETEWLWRGRSMKLVTQVETDDEWQSQWWRTWT